MTGMKTAEEVDGGNESADEDRWLAVVDRSVVADGTFVYSVRTTGVYCRPSCVSRQAKRQNVDFYGTSAEAEKAGYRPCERCRPHEPPVAERRAQLVAEGCRLIEQSDGRVTLVALAKNAATSPRHFHRIFREVTGVTPKAYAQAYRARRIGGGLSGESTVTEAVYAVNQQPSGFYATTASTLGMNPAQYRKGGEGQVIRFGVGDSSLGAVLVAATERGVCAILLGDDPQDLLEDLQRRFPNGSLVGGDAEFERWMATVIGFVEMPRLGLDLPLDIRGTAFQQRVWQALREIPIGTTASYAAVADRLAVTGGARAIAGACAANALAVVIPCHRVVRSDGALSGYRWGVERKRELLQREVDD